MPRILEDTACGMHVVVKPCRACPHFPGLILLFARASRLPEPPSSSVVFLLLPRLYETLQVLQTLLPAHLSKLFKLSTHHFFTPNPNTTNKTRPPWHAATPTTATATPLECELFCARPLATRTTLILVNSRGNASLPSRSVLLRSAHQLLPLPSAL